MKKEWAWFRMPLIFAFFVFLPDRSFAVPPPDFIFNIIHQASHGVSVLGVFFLAFLGGFFRFLKIKWVVLRENRIIVLLASSSFLLVLGFVSYVGFCKYQKRAKIQWEEESRIHSLPRVPVDPPMVTHNEFTALLKDRKNNPIVLDAREDVEWNNGHIPGSLHVRFADLRAGKYMELPRDRIIYVVCYSSLRGKEVAAFLVKRGIQAKYLENGVEKWVRNNGYWSGRLSLAETHKKPNERRVFTTQEIKQLFSKVFIVDCREPDVFLTSPFPGAINLSITSTPTSEMERAFNQIPPKSKVLLVCDDKLSCFDAFVTGIELEKRGHHYLGRYPTPWEWDASHAK